MFLALIKRIDDIASEIDVVCALRPLLIDNDGRQTTNKCRCHSSHVQIETIKIAVSAVSVLACVRAYVQLRNDRCRPIRARMQ